MNASFEQLRLAYARLEPDGTDTWNPLYIEVELWHRIRLMLELTAALRQLGRPAGSLRVLDVGCGVGRSSRLLVDLGIPPENIVGLDLRPGALALARRLNPAIRYHALADWDDWPGEAFDLCLQCTALSSLADPEARAETARRMDRSAGPGGYIYWWDVIRADPFAGGDRLQPLRLFPTRPALFARAVGVRPSLAEAAASLPRGARLARRLFACLPTRKTHQSILFGGPLR